VKDDEELEYDQQLPYSDVHIFGKKVAGRAVNSLYHCYQVIYAAYKEFYIEILTGL
jgi:hypothetical protein